jgi:catechol 2,3-dioxygenase-like lactoylglutathione lyase family enzyme
MKKSLLKLGTLFGGLMGAMVVQANVEVHHIVLAVSQADTAKSWYTRHLPCEEVAERPERLLCGGMQIELEARQSIGGSQGTSVNHIGFSYPDVAAKMQSLADVGVGGAGVRLQRFPGGELVEGDEEHGLHGFIFDPWGTRIELVQAEGEPAFHHIHLASVDPSATQSWYVEHLGAEPQGTGVELGGTPFMIEANSEGRPAATKERAIDHIALVADDLDAVSSDLADSGVQLRGPTVPANARGGAERTLLASPDGVRIAIVSEAWDGIGDTQTQAAEMAQTDVPFDPPRTPWGEPDLQGMWSGNVSHGIPLERPDDVATGELTEEQAAARREQGTLASIWGYEREWRDTTLGYDKFQASRQVSIIIDPPNGKLPETTTVGAEAAAAAAMRRLVVAAGPEDLSSWVRCITRGMPTMMMSGVYNNGLQIQQSPGYVAVQKEMIHETRLIPTTEKPRNGIKQWLGSSRGYWEGDTLVVQIKDFNGRAAYRGAGDNMTMTERYRLVDENTLEYQFTIDDPTIWKAPWTGMFHFKRHEDQYELVEYACHEGNYGMTNILSAARTKDRELNEPSGD